MNAEQILVIFLVVAVTVASTIGIYYAVTGFLPGAPFITVTESPVSGNGIDETQSKFIFFYAPWCPFSKAAETPWASLKQDYKNNPAKYGKKTILFEDVNGDDQKGKMGLYGVTKYPTFKFDTGKKVYEMLGKPSVSSFQDFIKAVVDKESS